MDNLIESYSFVYLLLEFAVKSALILCLAWMAAFILRRHNPRWRMFVLRFAVVGVLVLPVLSILSPTIHIPVSWLEPSGPPAAQTQMNAPVHPMASDGISDDTLEKLVQPIHQMMAENTESPASPAVITESKPGEPWKTNYSLVLAGVWILGVLTVGLKTWYTHAKITRCIQRATPAPHFARQELDEIRDQMGITQDIGMRCLPEALTPFLYGWMNPVIIIPPRVIEDEYQNDLPAVLAHELSHVRSHDLVWKTCFRFVQAVFWFNPFAWLIRFSHDTVCEELSDAKAALYVGNTQSYSQTLARVTLDLLTNPPVLAGLSMARLPEIRQRLETLKRRIPMEPVSRTMVYSCILAGAVGLTGIAGFSVTDAEEYNVYPSIEAAGFSPFQVGEKWVYAHIGCRTGGSYIGLPVEGDRVREIVGLLKEPGKKRFLLKESWGDNDYDPPRMFLDKNRLVHKTEEGASILTFEPAVEWDWIHLDPGETLTLESIIKDEDQQGLFSFQSTRLKDETIRVPAGLFKNCQKIEMTVSFTPELKGKPQDYADFIFWYHPEANGLVKETVKFNPPGTDKSHPLTGTSMLKSYHVPGKEVGVMNDLDVKVEELKPMRVASFHAVSEAPEIDAWNQLQAWAEPIGLMNDCKRNPIFGFNNPNPTEAQKEYGYELWIAIGPEIESQGEIVIKDCPGGLYAVVHNINLVGMGKAYQGIWKWIQTNGQYKWRKSNELEKVQNPNAEEEDMQFDIYVPIEA